jgi:hypothetical protein
MHNMFQSGTDFWGGTWIRRITPFRETWVLTPVMAFPCVHGLTCYGTYCAYDFRASCKDYDHLCVEGQDSPGV